ncbi:sugar-binding transcriptional regulator [Lactiplantibacillus herbarum]|uniref:sugar-binding transcriptional regulator n=1 Tax=Lactiplantibacillus herbarum TaxID=1670446 RepID=UPI00064E94D7|nr:sugar-binding domain-containing protein [Lactiplantibacillus herbarum]
MNDMKHRRLLIDIARDYYLSKITIAQISDKYNVSRYLISKYLDEALANGLVKININTPVERNLVLEAKFKAAFHLDHIYIIKDTDTTSDDEHHIIEFAAETIQQRILQSRVVGVTWGSTVLSVIDSFQATPHDDLLFTQFMGDNLKTNAAHGSAPLVQKAAAKFGAQYMTLPAPLYLFNDQTHQLLAQEAAMAPAFAQFDQMDTLFTGIGTLASLDSIPVWKMNQSAILGTATADQVAGLLYGRPYDLNGRMLNTEHDKLFGARLATIMQVPVRFAVVKNKFKSQALLGALRGQLLTDVITDEAVANRVLQENQA